MSMVDASNWKALWVITLKSNSLYFGGIVMSVIAVEYLARLPRKH